MHPGLARLRELNFLAATRQFEPRAILTVSETADRYRVLSAEAGAVEPGRWRTQRVPYLREIQDSLSDPTCQRVVFVKSSQVGGSEVGLNWALHTMLVDPAPMLVLFPADEALKGWSTVKLDSMIRNCDALRGRVYDDLDGRRDDVGVLGDRQGDERHGAQQHDHDHQLKQREASFCAVRALELHGVPTAVET